MKNLLFSNATSPCAGMVAFCIRLLKNYDKNYILI